MDHIKMYEKFVKDNNLIINNESAQDFCDLLEDPAFNYELLSDEYVEKANILKTKKAKSSNYSKALKINSDSIPAKILYAYYLIDRYGLISLGKLNDDPMDSSKISYDVFLDLMLERTEDDLLHEKSINLDLLTDQDNIYYMCFESRLHLWVLKMKYMYELETYNFESAIDVGNRMLKYNKTDNFKVSVSLPYVYYNLGYVEEAKRFEALPTRSKIDKALLSLIISYNENNYDKMMFIVDEIKNLNEYLYTMLLTGDILIPGPDELIIEARIAYYSYSLIGDKNINKICEVLLQNYNK